MIYVFRKKAEQILLASVQRRMPSGRRSCVRFGCFEIDVDERVLRKSGVRVRLQEQPFEVLLALLESPGEIVTREQLRQRLWPEGTFVEFDHALNTAVKKIRAALCDDPATPRYVETIPRRGYRFLASVDTPHSTVTQLNDESGIDRTPRLRPGRRLRVPLVAFAIGTPLVMLSAWFFFHSPAPRKVSVAVLPFSNMNPDSSHKPVVVNFTEALAKQLQRTHPPSTVILEKLRTGAHSNAELSPIDYVVEGGVIANEQHLHVSVQLVRVSDQSCVWEKHVGRDSNDPNAGMEVAEEIVQQMQPTLASVSAESR